MNYIKNATEMMILVSNTFKNRKKIVIFNTLQKETVSPTPEHAYSFFCGQNKTI